MDSNRIHTKHTQGPVSELLGCVHLAPRQSHKSLGLWPVVLPEGTQPPGPDYVLLADALAAGTLRVEEVGGGSVPKVRATNRGAKPVLFLFGEEIVGAKQNRAANASFLIAPHSTEVVDVSCVEAGRWDSQHRGGFAPSSVVLGSRLREGMAARVAHARRAGAGFDASQGEVWRDIDQVMAFSGTRSPTSAYADVRRDRASELDDLCAAFRCVPRQVGFVATVGDVVTGVELIGRPEVFARAFDRLLRAHAVDATIAGLVRGRKHGATSPFAAPEDLLEALRQAEWMRGPSLGMGEDARLQSETLTGCALLCGGVVHLTAFPGRVAGDREQRPRRTRLRRMLGFWRPPGAGEGSA